MNLLHDLKRIDLARTTLQPAFAAYLRSSEYTDYLQKLENDEVERARVNCILLENMGLDPRRGDNVKAFFHASEGEITFVVMFYYHTNFVGTFTLPEDSVEAKAVLAAIEANLKGPLFQAALRSERVRGKARQRFRRIDDRASRAAAQYRETEYASNPRPGAPGHKGEYAYRTRNDAISSEALAIRDTVFNNARDSLLRREEMIAKASMAKSLRDVPVIETFVAKYIWPEGSNP